MNPAGLVDKTRYIPMIEAVPFYLFCIRPRRFGKSLWLSLLQHYYDVNQADNFTFLFGETYIGQHPTSERNSYLILFFNFAVVNPAVDKVDAFFEATGSNEIDSFLYYFGLLSIAGTVNEEPLLRIPNRTVKDLMYGYIRRAFDDVEVFKPDLWQLNNLIRAMAYHGDWRPFFDYLNEQIQQQASVGDHLQGEKMIHGFLLAYLNITHNFLTWSEREMGGGFVDLYLEPFLARYPGVKYGYLIELEYISNTQFSKKEFDQSLTREKAEAESQLHQYAADPRVQQIAQQVTLKKLVLIYKGWELVYAAEV